jgi:predicted amidohydrolase
MATPKNLRITLVQSSLHWEQPIKNLNQFSKHLSALKRNETDLIVLPEMFNTGFSMNASMLAEKPRGLTMQWMAEVARAINSAICGSLIIIEKNKFYNRFIWMNVDGTYEQYDKRHLFRMGKENGVFTAGTESVLINHKGWNICPLVCYDLRFPVWSRNQLDTKGNADFDLLLYVANWPSIRSYAWNQLLIARAIENQCYVAAVNRVGQDGKGIDHHGDSVILDPFGKPISKLKRNKKGIETVELPYKELAKFREVFPVMRDADKFKII